MVVHAISVDPNPKRFYERYGFTESLIGPTTFMISIADLDTILPTSRRSP
jgi:hypothetical protein